MNFLTDPFLFDPSDVPGPVLVTGAGGCIGAWDRWKLSVFDNVEWGELYDLVDDPGEFRNLWNDKNYSTTRAQLTERLLREEIASVNRAPFPTGQA